MKVMRKRKRRLKPVPVMIAVLLVLAIGALVWFTCTSLSCTSVPAGPGEISASSGESSEEESSEPVPKPTSVRLIGFGDDLIHVSIFKQAKARATDGGYDFSYAYEPIKDVIQLADIASINQETVMAKDKAPSGYPLFNTPQELAGCLANLGFDVANLANNHVMDQGESGLKSTLDLWDSIPSVLTTGAYQNEEDFEDIRTLERNGITFSFLGMTELTNGLSLPSDTELVVLRTQDEERVKAQIEKAKSISDVVVVNVHWGVEYTHKPTEYQYEYAQKLADWGADIILGHHAHVIQPVEWITRADGTRALCVYSLGNFISTQEMGATMIGGGLDVTVTKEYENNTVSITSARFIPTVTHYEWGKANVRVYPLDEYTDELAAKHGIHQHISKFDLAYINQTVSSVIDEEFLTPYR